MSEFSTKAGLLLSLIHIYFILGTTVIPDKKNYDISELGLSVEAAKNLYTGKVNNDVVNRLLANPRFAMVTYMIAQYMDDTLARGCLLYTSRCV